MSKAPQLSFTTFLLKLLAGGAGGVAGTLILLLIFVLAESVLTPLTVNSASDVVSPVFVFILMMMIFVSSTASNILSVWLLSLTERERYTKISSTIYQVFIISLMIFLLMVPVYFIASTMDGAITAYTVGLHIIIAAQVSALILEIISNYRYSLLGVYGVTFSILMSAGILFAIMSTIASPLILLFAAIPVVWFSIAFVQSIVTMLYSWLVNVYDKDFLSADELYGDDYGRPDSAPSKKKTPRAKDEAGAAFLRKNG